MTGVEHMAKCVWQVARGDQVARKSWSAGKRGGQLAGFTSRTDHG